MLETDFVTTAILCLIVVAGGVLRWWSGRALLRHVDDPAFPERLIAAKRQRTIVFAVFAAALVALSPTSAAWTLPLLAISRMIGGFPIRKALYHETWSVAAYLWFFARLFASVFGFWIVLVLLPLLGDLAAPRRWSIVLPLAAVLVIWNGRSAAIIRYALRTRPVDDPVLTERFEAMAMKCAVQVPRFERVDLHGGAVANAIALPSVHSPAVLVSETLLDRLDADETAAICAHELAHLEYFNPPRLRRVYAANIALIVCGCMLSVLQPRISGLVTDLAWVLILVMVLGRRTRHRQRNETASDLRAIALGGDAEALVRGLTKLYVFARMPRRMDPELERRATHPSLARRIRDIRKAAGAAQPSVEAAASFTSPDGRTSAVFAADRLEWREGEAATHSLSYAYLNDVRVCPARSGSSQLVAVERGGRRWEMALDPKDLSRAQQVLDVVDGRLADAVPLARHSSGLARGLVALTALAGAATAQFALVIVAVIAAAQPSASLIGGAALGSLAAAAVMLQQGSLAGSFYAPWIPAVPAAMGLVLLAVAFSIRGEDTSSWRNLPTTVLDAAVALAVLPILISGFDPIRVNEAARAMPGAVVLVMALAGSFAFRRKRALRYAAVVLVLLGAALAFARSTTFLNRFGHDPLLVRADPVAVRILDKRQVGQFSVPFYVSELRLSPGGAHVATVSATEAQGDDDGEQTTRFHVGAAGGPLAAIAAQEAMFADEEDLLVTQPERGGVTVRQVSIDPVGEIWQQHVDQIGNARLSYIRSTRTWRLLGRDDQQRIVRAEGIVGSSVIQETRWPVPPIRGGWIDTIAAAGDRALVSETSLDRNLLQQRRLLSQWIWMLQAPSRQSRFWTIGADGRNDLGVSRLAPRCLDGAMGDDRLVCAAFDGADTRFIALDPATGHADPVGQLRGRFAVYRQASAGWLSGWCDAAPIALRLATREAFRAAPDPLHRITGVVAGEHVAGTVSFNGGHSVVRLYAID